MITSLPFTQSPQLIDCACRGYSESIPNSLHKDGPGRNHNTQLFNLYPQYPLRYSYSSSFSYLSLAHNISGKEMVTHLYNNDVFRGKNFLDKVVICHRWM